MKARTVSAHLDGELLERLKAQAVEQDRSVSWLISAAVEMYLGARREAVQPFRDGAARHFPASDLGASIAAAVKRGPSRSSARHK